jgi:CPA2 family monovalent cation:H+ antiporter-2
MRDAFAVLFFVSIGMLFDPIHFVQSPGLIAATLAIVLIGKPLAALAIVSALRYPLAIGLSVAVALAQIGEFSFMLAALARQLAILPEAGTSAIVAAALISITLNPLLFRSIGWLEKRLMRSGFAAWSQRTTSPAAEEESSLGGLSAVVVGYGPVGRSLTRMLIENHIAPTVVELNLDTVHRLRDDGIRAVYGDSTHRQTLEEAGVKHAAAFILTSAGMQASDEAIRLARELNPAIRVLVRASYLKEIPALRRAGADIAFSGEGEVALTMTEFLLRQLGATEEQIDRQRERIREELFGSPLAMQLLLPLPVPQATAPEETAKRAANASVGSDGEADSNRQEVGQPDN